MRKVIINSTPLIAISKVHMLDLLRDMFGEVFIPAAVYREVTAKNDFIRDEIAQSNWIHVDTIRSTESRKMYRAKLHDGEIEVMILAQEHGHDHLVVIDDRSARRTAEYLGLNLTGTIGVLIQAKQRGLIDFVMPVIISMEAEGIYFSEALKARIQRVSGEH